MIVPNLPPGLQGIDLAIPANDVREEVAKILQEKGITVPWIKREALRPVLDGTNLPKAVLVGAQPTGTGQ